MFYKNKYIKNIYYMLSYAFKVLNENGYKSIETEDFDNIAELCAAILCRGMSLQIKQGLNKDYVNENEPLSTLKGKIGLSESIKNVSMINKKMYCSYNIFSVNSYLNQIIKTTLKNLFRADISRERKLEIKRVLDYLSEVEEIDLGGVNWKIRFNRNNQHYRMLISICYLVFKGLLQTSERGGLKTMSFLDEQSMHRLYEKFILEFYRKEFKAAKVNSKQIKWAEDNNYLELLPIMQSDVMIEYGDKILIIDAKFYKHELQNQYDKDSVRSGNIYQIFTYVKNKAISDPDKEVSGMLLYAQTEDATHPDNDYIINGNKISVKTLNLGTDFSEIKKSLQEIFYSNFGVGLAENT